MTKAAAVLRKKTAYKTEMDRRFSQPESDRMWQDAHVRLDSFFRKYKNLPKGVQTHTEKYIFPAAAVYMSMKETHPETAYAVMEKVMRERSEKIGHMIAGMTKIPGFKQFFINIWDPICRKMFGEKSGFRNVFYPKEKNAYRMDIIACPYHKYLTELGCSEINRLFCENDVYTYGHLPGLKFTRTQTIGQGGELCDFRMELEKSEKKR